MKIKEILPSLAKVRLIISVPLVMGAMLVGGGIGQFLVFMSLDELGVIEVGNALGPGLLMWFSVNLGMMFLLIGVIFASVKALWKRR